MDVVSAGRYGGIRRTNSVATVISSLLLRPQEGANTTAVEFVCGADDCPGMPPGDVMATLM